MTASSAPIASIGPGVTPGAVQCANLLAGTMVATNLDETRRFFEHFLGLDCVRSGADRLLARDQRTKAAMQTGGQGSFVLDIRLAASIENPQRQLHHWGLTVSSAAEVDRIHAAAKGMKDAFGIRKLFPVADIHGSHSFYMADRDMNWWEVEHRLDGRDNETFFSRGDFEPGRKDEPAPAAEVAAPGRAPGDPIIVGAELTHGTVEQFDLPRSRRFVEQVLGLRCVHHIPPAQIIAGSGPFGIFGIRLPRIKPQQFKNRWVVGVDGTSGVRAVCERARASRDPLGLMSVDVSAGGEACNIQDADGNWWEIVANETTDYAAIFERGDR